MITFQAPRTNLDVKNRNRFLVREQPSKLSQTKHDVGPNCCYSLVVLVNRNIALVRETGMLLTSQKGNCRVQFEFFIPGEGPGKFQFSEDE